MSEKDKSIIIIIIKVALRVTNYIPVALSVKYFILNYQNIHALAAELAL